MYGIQYIFHLTAVNDYMLVYFQGKLCCLLPLVPQYNTRCRPTCRNHQFVNTYKRKPVLCGFTSRSSLPAGVGKTTAIRELARLLADEIQKRVVIVDTSNEIGGDGDIPHNGVGSSRRMQVAHCEEQHRVMIEAVEVEPQAHNVQNSGKIASIKIGLQKSRHERASIVYSYERKKRSSA